jgi:HD-GYP domain-containing protein (c-di-GMP phosphodiesterase class II)
MLEFTAGRGFHFSDVEQTRLRLGEDHAGRAALERITIAIPDLSETNTPFTNYDTISREGFQAYYALPLIAKGEVKGVMEIFHRKAITHDLEWMNFLETLAGQAAITVDNAQLFQGLQRSNLELSLAYDATIEGWSRALDLRDKETEGHTQRVTDLTLVLAVRFGVRGEDLVHTRRGTLLHDIGKMGIPDNILLKPGPLTEEEWVIMRKHPVYAYELLYPIDYLRPALDIPYCHHEKWDGSGYPRELKDDQIPLTARIFSVIDVWDAITSDRPYRPAWPKDKALEYLRAEAGRHFDPNVSKVFLGMIHEMNL